MRKDQKEIGRKSVRVWLKNFLRDNKRKHTKRETHTRKNMCEKTEGKSEKKRWREWEIRKKWSEEEKKREWDRENKKRQNEYEDNKRETERRKVKEKS